MPATLKTQRLTLRQFQDADLDTYAEICADPAVMKHIGQGQSLHQKITLHNSEVHLYKITYPTHESKGQ